MLIGHATNSPTQCNSRARCAILVMIRYDFRNDVTALQHPSRIITEPNGKLLLMIMNVRAAPDCAALEIQSEKRKNSTCGRATNARYRAFRPSQGAYPRRSFAHSSVERTRRRLQLMSNTARFIRVCHENPLDRRRHRRRQRLSRPGRSTRPKPQRSTTGCSLARLARSTPASCVVMTPAIWRSIRSKKSAP